MFESYEFYKTTRSACPVCRTIIPAKIVFVGENVHMIKVCAEHGEYRSLIARDRRRYLASLSISKPALVPLKHTHESFEGCNLSCGLCPEHQQHTCLPIIEITDYCNLSCPLCLVQNTHGWHIGLDEFSTIVQTLVDAEGTLDLINISGGEPAMHPDLLGIVDRARRKEIRNISMSTNGLVFLKNRGLLDELVKRKVYISLQFDGFERESYQSMRGKDLLEDKLKLLALLEQAGAKASLVMTVVRGLNDHQVGAVTDLLLEKEFIKSLMIQPLAFTNPGYAYDAEKVFTISDAVRALGAAQRAEIRPEDVTSLPCSHPSCFSLVYLLKLQSGGFIPLTRLVDIETYLDVIKNKTVPGLDEESFDAVKENVYELWSATGSQPDSEKILQTLRNLICEMGKCGNSPSPQAAFSVAENNIKSIFVHSFMDPYNFDLARAMKCCNQYPEHGELVPCCVRNTRRRSL